MSAPQTAKSDVLLAVADVRKSFRTPDGSALEVLTGVSFEVKAGEMVAVMGASGAGKSTLLNVVSGLDGADSGSIVCLDKEVTRMSNDMLARHRARNVGFVFQFHHLLADLSAAENVALSLRINRIAGSESVTRANEILQSLGLGPRANYPAHQLSGGEQQRVAVARALVSEPGIVMADEPTGNLDAAHGEEIGAILLGYCRRRRAAVLVATHNERIAGQADRVLRLEAGKLV